MKDKSRDADGAWTGTIPKGDGFRTVKPDEAQRETKSQGSFGTGLCAKSTKIASPCPYPYLPLPFGDLELLGRGLEARLLEVDSVFRSRSRDAVKPPQRGEWEWHWKRTQSLPR